MKRYPQSVCRIPMGCEFTFHSTKGEYKNDSTPQVVKSHLYMTCAEFDTAQKKGEFRQASACVDDHVLEIRSPVFRRYADGLRFRRKLIKWAKAHDLCIKRHDAVDGGCHMHFDCACPEQRSIIMRATMAYPSLAWALTEPDDTDNSDNFASNPVILKEVQEFYRARTDIHNYVARQIDNYVTRQIVNCGGMMAKNKIYCVSVNNGGRTIEYRCVEMFEREDDFFHTWQLLEELTNCPYDVANQPIRSWKNWSAKDAVANFHEFCDRMYFNKRVFTDIINRNLRPRWTRKRVRQ